MAEIQITASQWRLVEVGRVVLFTHGEFTDRLAVIVEIIDHKRVRDRLQPYKVLGDLTKKSGPRGWSLKIGKGSRTSSLRRSQ